MPRLAHADLTVELLDPAADRARFGPRFCAGGYLWQVHDARVGPLLTGPEWPNPAPAPHNGQGLPESFRHSTTTGQPLLWDGTLGLAPGAGALGRDPAGAATLVTPCTWSVETSAQRAVFRTEQEIGRWSYELVRTVELHERRLVSASHLVNRGAAPLDFEWFAHPFFALRDGRAIAALPPGTALPENPGFALAGNELTFRRTFAHAHDGHLDHLALPPGQPLAATLSHPKIEYVRFATSFVPFKCVVWANDRTLSLEPYLALHLAPGATQTWSLHYEFGPPLTPDRR